MLIRVSYERTLGKIQYKMIVIFDNGHGKETKGKRSPIWSDGSQLFEYEFNRDITSRCIAKLTHRGFQTHLLVPEINDITLEERVRRANKIKDSILISIHANGGGGTGFEGWTSRGQTKADELCEYIYNSFSWHIPDWKLRKDSSDGDSDKESGFYMIRWTNMPAVLLECGFMDTESDCYFMMSENGRDKISDAIVDGVINYIQNKH